MVQLLVEAGADVNAEVRGDGNAIIHAVMNEDFELTEYLLEQGADPTAYVPGDDSAIIHASESGNTRMLKLLLHYAN